MLCHWWLQDSLQRAENAAVRGLKRRQDEVKRMTFELHDPLVEEAQVAFKGKEWNGTEWNRRCQVSNHLQSL